MTLWLALQSCLLSYLIEINLVRDCSSPPNPTPWESFVERRRSRFQIRVCFPRFIMPFRADSRFLLFAVNRIVVGAEVHRQSMCVWWMVEQRPSLNRNSSSSWQEFSISRQIRYCCLGTSIRLWDAVMLWFCYAYMPPQTFLEVLAVWYWLHMYRSYMHTAHRVLCHRSCIDIIQLAHIIHDIPPIVFKISQTAP